MITIILIQEKNTLKNVIPLKKKTKNGNTYTTYIDVKVKISLVKEGL